MLITAQTALLNLRNEAVPAVSVDADPHHGQIWRHPERFTFIREVSEILDVGNFPSPHIDRVFHGSRPIRRLTGTYNEGTKILVSSIDGESFA